MHRADKKDIYKLAAIHAIISLAEQFPIDDISLCNTEPIYPVTTGERLVNFALDLVLMTEWQAEENEKAVTEIASILSQLDTGVDKPEEWRDLFSANKALGEYLHQRSIV